MCLVIKKRTKIQIAKEDIKVFKIFLKREKHVLGAESKFEYISPWYTMTNWQLGEEKSSEVVLEFFHDKGYKRDILEKIKLSTIFDESKGEQKAITFLHPNNRSLTNKKLSQIEINEGLHACTKIWRAKWMMNYTIIPRCYSWNHFVVCECVIPKGSIIVQKGFLIAASKIQLIKELE